MWGPGNSPVVSVDTPDNAGRVHLQPKFTIGCFSGRWITLLPETERIDGSPRPGLRLVQQFNGGKFFAFQHRQAGPAAGADV